MRELCEHGSFSCFSGGTSWGNAKIERTWARSSGRASRKCENWARMGHLHICVVEPLWENERTKRTLTIVTTFWRETARLGRTWAICAAVWGKALENDELGEHGPCSQSSGEILGKMRELGEHGPHSQPSGGGGPWKMRGLNKGGNRIPNKVVSCMGRHLT